MKQKKTNIKQTRTKSGQIRFYQNGKRISEKKALPILQKQQKARIERGKKASEGILYYKGKALSKAESYLLSLKIPEKVKTEKRLDKMLKADGTKLFPSKADINRQIIQQGNTLKDFFGTENVYGNFKGGKYTGKVEMKGSVDIAEFLKQGAFSRFKVILYTPDSRVIRGKVSVVSYLSVFELQLMDLIIKADQTKGTKVSFDYSIEVSTNMQSVYIDLQIAEQGTIEEAIDEAVKNEQSTISYYKDLVIRIGYS